jgi:hypothetical protein
MRRFFVLGTGLLLCAAIARADDRGSSSPANRNCDSCGAQAAIGLTVGPDPFRAGDQVVRDRATGQPLYRAEPLQRTQSETALLLLSVLRSGDRMAFVLPQVIGSVQEEVFAPREIGVPQTMIIPRHWVRQRK